MFGQTLSSLTLVKPRMQGKNGQREYIADFLLQEKILQILFVQNSL
jgi:hypothetical protein